MNLHSPIDGVAYFARTNHRNTSVRFGIKEADRFSHMYVVGKTGTGKSTLLETLISQDIDRGNGCALIDPHGDLVERIASSIPDHRKGDVIYLNVPDPKQPYGYNPLQHVSPPYRSLAASGFMDVFKGMWQTRPKTRCVVLGLEGITERQDGLSAMGRLRHMLPPALVPSPGLLYPSSIWMMYPRWQNPR